ncbi:uncharacterized protein [Battus philenor]|uniref:uncharacterized protein n=1 Tax=Battus philenor TaxID=42288 RepID=UPI0035CF9980
MCLIIGSKGSFLNPDSVSPVWDATPLACLEEDETAAHVLLRCNGVATHNAIHFKLAKCLTEIAGYIKGSAGIPEMSRASSDAKQPQCRLIADSSPKRKFARRQEIMLYFTGVSAFQKCSEILCSHVFDEVCGLAQTFGGVKVLKKFQNECHLTKIKCKLKSILDLKQVSDRLCNIKRKTKFPYGSGRRVHDFSIVGAHQACNHTCPTFCVDTYEPACAQIWKPNMESYNYRPMINHCHIDLFSCALGVNVTIQPLGKCYKNPSGLLFMTQVAALKSLGLIDETPLNHSKKRVNNPNQEE